MIMKMKLIFSINLPLYIEYGVKKKRRFSLNINRYRNTNHFVLNNIKHLFEDLVSPQLDNCPKGQTKCSLEYVLFTGNRKKIDTNNVCCIVDKFFQDVLVNKGILKDDSYEYVTKTTFSFGGIDVQNPRVTVTITFN